MNPTFPPWLDEWLEAFARALQLVIDGLAAACRALWPSGTLAAQLRAVLARGARPASRPVPWHAAGRHAVRPRAADFKRRPQRLPCRVRT